MQQDPQKWARAPKIKLTQAKYSYLPFALSSGEEEQWAEDITCSVLCVCVCVCWCVCVCARALAHTCLSSFQSLHRF
jgi:hypothetical protein